MDTFQTGVSNTEMKKIAEDMVEKYKKARDIFEINAKK